MEPDNPNPIIFSATLTPHRSLNPRAFGMLMGGIALVWFLTGFYFYLRGAWPVFGFFGLDFVLLYLAFRLNFRAARAYEEVELGRDLLVIRKVTPRGHAQEIRFNPYWVRLEIEREEEEGVKRVTVRTKDRAVPVGTFLNPDDRTSFAGAFSAALAETRR